MTNQILPPQNNRIGKIAAWGKQIGKNDSISDDNQWNPKSLRINRDTLENMQIRNIGIIGYGVVAPVVFLLLGIAFQQKTKHG